MRQSIGDKTEKMWNAAVGDDEQTLAGFSSFSRWVLLPLSSLRLFALPRAPVCGPDLCRFLLL